MRTMRPCRARLSRRCEHVGDVLGAVIGSNTPLLAILLALACLAGEAGRSACAADKADEFWRFYEKYPHMQDFFPFGTWGGAPTVAQRFWQDCSATPKALEYASEAHHAIPLDTGWEEAVERTRGFIRDRLAALGPDEG